MLWKINVSITNEEDLNKLIDILDSKWYTWVSLLKLREAQNSMHTMIYYIKQYKTIYINIYEEDKTITRSEVMFKKNSISFKEYKERYCKKEYTFNIKIK